MEATTRLIDLTVQDLRTIIRQEISQGQLTLESLIRGIKPSEKPEGPLYGIQGIAEALHVSHSTAIRLKSQHRLEGGYQQFGRHIIIKDPQALRDIAEASGKKRRRVV